MQSCKKKCTSDLALTRKSYPGCRPGIGPLHPTHPSSVVNIEPEPSRCSLGHERPQGGTRPQPLVGRTRHPDSKVRGANMGPIWGRQDPGGPHVGPMNFAI